MLPKDFKISSFIPPVIVNLPNGTFVCPGWFAVDENVTLEEVYKHWIKIGSQEIKDKTVIVEKVISSKGDKKYDVVFDGINWMCNCVGFGFHRNCRHVMEIKEKYNKI